MYSLILVKLNEHLLIGYIIVPRYAKDFRICTGSIGEFIFKKEVECVCVREITKTKRRDLTHKQSLETLPAAGV